MNNDEGWMNNDEGWRMNDDDFKLFRGFADWQTDICDCRAAFVSEQSLILGFTSFLFG